MQQDKICDGARVGRAVSARYFMPDERWTRSSRSRLLDDSASIEALKYEVIVSQRAYDASSEGEYDEDNDDGAGWLACCACLPRLQGCSQPFRLCCFGCGCLFAGVVAIILSLTVLSTKHGALAAQQLTLQMSELWTWQLRQAPHHHHHGNTQRTAAGWQATHMQDPDTIHAEEQQNNPNAVKAETAARVQPVVVVQQLRAGGFTAKQLKDNGFSSAELRAGGFTSVPDDTPLPAPASVRATGDTAAVDEADADGAPWPPRPPLPPPPLLSQAG